MSLTDRDDIRAQLQADIADAIGDGFQPNRYDVKGQPLDHLGARQQDAFPENVTTAADTYEFFDELDA